MSEDDLIHKEYFKYREIIDSFDELYNDLFVEMWKYLGDPVYALDYKDNPKGDVEWLWEGPFSKATYLHQVELYLDRVIENNSIGILTNYYFIEPLTLEEIYNRSRKIATFKDLIEKGFKEGENIIVGSWEEDYSRRIRFWVNDADPRKYTNVEIIAYFEIPIRYKILEIDFSHKIRQKIQDSSDIDYFDNIPDKEFNDLQITEFNLEFDQRMKLAISEFGNEFKIEIENAHKQFIWEKAIVNNLECVYTLEISEGEEGIGYIETWILKNPPKPNDLKKYYPILNDPPSQTSKTPNGNKVFIYNKIEKTRGVIHNFGFTRDLFPRIYIITQNKYFYLPKHYTKAYQN